MPGEILFETVGVAEDRGLEDIDDPGAQSGFRPDDSQSDLLGFGSSRSDRPTSRLISCACGKPSCTDPT